MHAETTPPQAGRLVKILEKVGIPQRHAASSLPNWIDRPGTEKGLNAAQEWITSPLTDQGFMLLGTPGTGKTHLAVAALRGKTEAWLAEQDADAKRDIYYQPSAQPVHKMRFLNVPLFLERLRSQMRYSDGEASQLFEYCLDKASVVVLDDLGKERATDWASEKLYVLIESRYSACKPTIATSNRTLDELDDLGYGPAISRLQHTCRVVRMDAPDYRPRARAAEDTAAR